MLAAVAVVVMVVVVVVVVVIVVVVVMVGCAIDVGKSSRSSYGSSITSN